MNKEMFSNPCSNRHHFPITQLDMTNNKGPCESIRWSYENIYELLISLAGYMHNVQETLLCVGINVNDCFL